MTRFTLYSSDTMTLVNQITTKVDDDRRRFEICHFDVDNEGNITVHVDGKEPIKL